jgi:hypothetical protein
MASAAAAATPTFTIVTTGSRDWDNVTVICSALAAAKARMVPEGACVTVHHGGCAGADTWVGHVAKHIMGWEVRAWPTDWRKEGKRAGPVRNSRMIKEAHPDLVIAFAVDLAASKGTQDAYTKARNAAKHRMPDEPPLTLWHYSGRKHRKK